MGDVIDMKIWQLKRGKTADELQRQADALDDAGKQDEAREVLVAALQIDPQHPWSLLLLGVIDYRRGFKSKAHDVWHAALSNTTDVACMARLHYNLGFLQAENGSLKAAVHHFCEAERLEPDFADLHYNLADSLAGLGHFAESAVHWRRYIELDEQGEWVAQAHARLRQIEKML